MSQDDLRTAFGNILHKYCVFAPKPSWTGQTLCQGILSKQRTCPSWHTTIGRISDRWHGGHHVGLPSVCSWKIRWHAIYHPVMVRWSHLWEGPWRPCVGFHCPHTLVTLSRALSLSLSTGASYRWRISGRQPTLLIVPEMWGTFYHLRNVLGLSNVEADVTKCMKHAREFCEIILNSYVVGFALGARGQWGPMWWTNFPQITRRLRMSS